MSVWVLEAEIALLLSALLAPLALPVYIAYEYRNHGRFTPWNGVLGGVTLLYALAIPAFTLLPVPAGDYCETSSGVSHIQLNPFASFANIAASIGDTGLASTLTSGVFLEVIFNIAFFVPLGILVAYRFGWSLRRTLLAGFALSLIIELTQGTGVWGLSDCPYRLADVDDLITNTTGAGVGWVFGRWLSPHLPEPNPPMTDDAAPPGLIRRATAWAGDFIGNAILGLGIVLVALGPILISRGVEVREESWFVPVEVTLGTVLPVLLLQLLWPLIRRDSATPGKVTTWLAVTGANGPAGPGETSIRFAIRWLGFCIAVYWSVPIAFAFLMVPDVLSVLVRKDRRSLAALLSGTDTRTRRSLEVETFPSTSGPD